VLVLSIDGLDARYLNQADQLKFKIPNIRRLMKEGAWAGPGVIGVVPTVTWPSHTTIISSVDSAVHGILGNRRPRAEGREYYWSARLLKAPTLLDTAAKAGKSTAAITWPVTVDAPVTYNLPEYFAKRRGGGMDLRSIASKGSRPDLAAQITRVYPSFPQEWINDRTRAVAVLFLLRRKPPDLTLVHFVDLDSEAHDHGPFSPEANAILEYQDELIGRMLTALPSDGAFVLVSDHGFERVDTEVNLSIAAAAKGVKGVRSMGGVAIAETETPPRSWAGSTPATALAVPSPKTKRRVSPGASPPPSSSPPRTSGSLSAAKRNSVSRTRSVRTATGPCAIAPPTSPGANR
jgi:predicted AlkP superfamily pyrophosphatase or phosphodiesterase